MSEHKGYLTETGRVVQRKRSSPDPGHRGWFSQDFEKIIGRVFYVEKRYNLRRVFVTRTWVVDLGENRRVEAATRGAAIEKALGR